MKYYEIILSGRVQGVGFRYYTYRLAQQYNIKGYVKNLRNGDVKIVAGSSDKQKLDEFLQEVSSGPSSARVTNTNREELETSDSYKEFNIKY